MDNDNKPSKTIKLEVPSTPHHNDLGKSVSPHGLAEYDYFTPVLAVDVWPTILSYVTEKKDLESAMNTCQLFNDILHPRAFTELILPLLLLKKNLSPESVLACRGINQNAKSTVENIFFNSGSPWFYPFSTLLGNPENFIDFITETLPNLPPGFNLFISKRAVFQASHSLELQHILTLTKHYGTNLTELNICLYILPDVNEQVEPLEQFLQALSNTPHLRILIVRVNMVEFDLPYVNEENQVTAFSFPMLDNLSDLTLAYNAVFELLQIPFAYPVTPLVSRFMQSFIRSYGPQLDTFSCNKGMLDIGLPADFISSNLTNIKQFQMITTPSQSTLDIMAQFEFPRLERLALKPVPFGIPFSSSLLHVLENFGDTLTEIHCGSLDEIEDGIVKNWKPMSKLTKLTVYWKSFDSGFWPDLKVMLTNLRCLKFQSNSFPEEAPVPAYNRRQAFFNMFPQLEKLIWRVYGKELCFIEKTFIRNVKLPVCRYYEVPNPTSLLHTFLNRNDS
ncbi:unnamed protein product [Orchesella dallaii]|uniref:F-box domain-containing protein n=1 Tax=Orchesella dallaii TaxID=48710 RepID=A0ABP1PPM6_9HEXA